MKKLNITKEQFNHSNYFQRKYGKLEYVSESGKLFKTNKGKILKFNEGTFWPTPENERIPIYTIELIRVDDDGSHDETPMQYQTFYYSDDTAFAAAENLADKFANEDGKFEVHVMAGEYVIDGSTDIYGDPYVDGSIQTGRGWKMVKESLDYTVSLRDIIKNDPTEFALAMDSLMDGLAWEVEKYRQVFQAITYVSNPAIKEALMNAYVEASKRADEQL